MSAGLTPGTPSGALAKKLVAVMAAVDYIPKTGRNTAQSYDYVTDTDVLDTIRKELVKQNVATLTGVTDIDTIPFTTNKESKQFLVTVKGYVSFVDGDTGEEYIAEGVGQGADSMDKGVYKAITGMLKYILLKTLLTPTGDDPERDDERTTKASTGMPATREGNEGQPSRVGLTDKQRGLLKAKLTEAGLSQPQSVAFLLTVGVPANSKQMTSEHLDKVLTALGDTAKVERVKAEIAE